MRHARSNGIVIAIAGAALLGACSDSAAPPTATPPACAATSVPALALAAPARVPDASPYDSLFAAASAEFRVPAAVLRAVSYVETRWQMVEGREEFEGVPAAHGLMALRGARLRDGARRVGLAEAIVRRDPAANVRAAAALLRADADSLGVSEAADVDAWAPVVDRYARAAGIALPEARDAYVRDVLAVREGRRAAPARASVAAQRADCPAPPTPTTPTPTPNVVDQAGAVWRPSPNFNARMTGDGGVVHVVIVHSCEGPYAGCWSWLASPASGVSAHYVVREDGAEITQLVREAARAWHIGATYDSTLNAGHDGRLHGVQSNHFTIGIEHAGYASQSTWPEAQIDASARLVCALSRRWQIPRDRLHVVSHGQLQPYNRTDPGRDWPWADYLARIERHCAA